MTTIDARDVQLPKNPIVRGQLDLAAANAEITALRTGMNDLRNYLRSTKFTAGVNNDLVNVRDVLTRLEQVDATGYEMSNAVYAEWKRETISPLKRERTHAAGPKDSRPALRFECVKLAPRTSERYADTDVFYVTPEAPSVRAAISEALALGYYRVRVLAVCRPDTRDVLDHEPVDENDRWHYIATVTDQHGGASETRIAWLFDSLKSEQRIF